MEQPRIKRNMPPSKPKNEAQREREYLTREEVIRLVESAFSAGRYGLRDAAIILMAYRHGLRPSDISALRWLNCNLSKGTLQIVRSKNGRESQHKLEMDELEMLAKLQAASADCEFVFSSERKGPLTNRSIHTIVARAGKLSGLEFPVHPHMLRHAKGFALAADGADSKLIQDYLGYRNRGSAVVYKSGLDANSKRGNDYP